MGTRGNAVPPKAFSVPSKKNSVPAKVISVPAKNTIAFPPKDFAFPSRKFAELQRTSSTTPPRNRAGKLVQLPPSNSQNFIDYPPPRNRAGKLLQLPPPPRSNSWNFIDYLFRLRSWWNALERCLESVPTVKNSHFNHWRWRTYGTRAQSGTRDDFTWHAKPKKFTKK